MILLNFFFFFFLFTIVVLKELARMRKLLYHDFNPSARVLSGFDCGAEVGG